MADGVGEVEVCGTVPDPDVAATVVPRVREVVEACADAPEHQVWTLHEADTGHESVTFSLTWSVGLGAPVFQLTRVGDALLMTHRYGEGMLETIDPTSGAGRAAYPGSQTSYGP